MDIDANLAAVKACNIVRKMSIGRQLKHEGPQFNGKTNNISPLLCVIRRLLEPALQLQSTYIQGE